MLWQSVADPVLGYIELYCSKQDNGRYHGSVRNFDLTCVRDTPEECFEYLQSRLKILGHSIVSISKLEYKPKFALEAVLICFQHDIFDIMDMTELVNDIFRYWEN
jgi:hypothetical protein